MARRFSRKRQLSALSEINVTPLIDLAFALLIIFMITTPLLEQSIDINLPVESHKEQSSAENNVTQVISVDSVGKIFWNDKGVDLPEFEQLVKGLSHKIDPVVDLRADAQVQYQHVVTVMDVLKAHNIRKISLNTQAG